MSRSPPNRVKISFPLFRDSDDYPPADKEHLWAISRGDKFQIDNIPFFAKGVSAGDMVAAYNDGRELIFDRVLEFGGHSTIRVVMYDLTQKEAIVNQLALIGCESEGSHLPNLFAVDVPAETNYAEVISFLMKEADKNMLDYEESSIQHRLN